MRARSSAKLRSLSCVRSDHCIPMFLSDVLVLMILSTIERKRNGDNRHAYRTPQTIEHLVSMGKPACHALVGVVDHGRAFRVLHSVSISTMSLSVHSVEYFLGVDEVNIEGEFSFPHSIMIRRLAI